MDRFLLYTPLHLSEECSKGPGMKAGTLDSAQLPLILPSPPIVGARIRAIQRVTSNLVIHSPDSRS